VLALGLGVQVGTRSRLERGLELVDVDALGIKV
jgi:hypothetical protein